MNMANASVDNILLNLKIISKIPENCKISRNFNGVLTLETNTYSNYLPFFIGFKRFVFGDSRERGISDINIIIDIAIDKCEEIINSVSFHRLAHSSNTTTPVSSDDNYIYDKLYTEYTIQHEILHNIYNELKHTIPGILNLKNKYVGDATVTSRIDIILSKIHNYTAMVKKRFFT